MADENHDARCYRGKALFVAEFLSTFQAFFRRNDADRKGPISINMLEGAIAYGENLVRHYDLENKLVIRKRDGTLSSDKVKEWEDMVAASKASIESTSATNKAVHELLRRFEVWSTNALANQILMYCVKSSNPKDKSICCSPLLNLPGISHFLPFLSQAAGDAAAGEAPKQHTCALSVPPNGWTWREYLRICNMISLLQDPEEATKSTVTAASPVLMGTTRKEELKMSEKDELSLADLAALWVRSQRNTSALLHLMHLFQVKKAPPEETQREPRFAICASSQYRGKQLIVTLDDDDDEEEKPSEPRYVVKYVGNHKKTRNHVLQCSGSLDKLIEWAITNQALFTFRYIRESIPERISQEKESTRKRKAPSDDGDTREEVDTKRIRTIPCEDEDKLLQACQCYVLRWFARRNRKVASILFTSKLEHIPLFPYQDLVEYLVEQNIPKRIKIDLKKRLESSDRTLARIDRRTKIGKFGGDDVNDVMTFHGVVVQLLKSLAKHVPADKLSEIEVQAACDDFEHLHETFLHGKSATEAARLLVDPDADIDMNNLAEILLSFTEPWDDCCCSCEQPIDGQGTGTFMCDSCSKHYHKTCHGDWDVRQVGELVEAFAPLAQLVETFSEDLKLNSGQVSRCSSCQVLTKPQPSENRVVAEAKLCKALIRDIGMESYSLPFHDESPPEGIMSKEYSRNVSLRRLDAMMEYICVENDPAIMEAEREKLLSTIGNPFCVPPWSPSLSQSQQLSWVTKEMLHHPLQLLCKGVEVMMLPPDGASRQWMDDRLSFARRFTILVSAWFPCTHQEPFTVQPSERLSHILNSRPPWTQISCIVCRARPSSTARAARSPVCDNILCQQRLPSGKTNACATQGSTSFSSEVRPASPHPPTGTNGFLDSYDELSSMVGSLIMVVPGDPMLDFISKELNESIAHLDRPMFFFVASYLPNLFSKVEPFSNSIDDEGIFHVLPVLTGSQLRYLLDMCVMRRPPDTYVGNDSWTQLAVLDLKGVIRMSASELRSKLKNTGAIRQAIDSVIGNLLGSARAGDLMAERCEKESHGCISVEGHSPSSSATGSECLNEMVRDYSSLIDCLLRSGNPLVRNIIGLLRPSTVNDDDLSVVESISNDVQASAVEDAGAQYYSADAEADAGSRERNLQRGSSEVVDLTTPTDLRAAALNPDSERPLAPSGNLGRLPLAAPMPPAPSFHPANSRQAIDTHSQQQQQQMRMNYQVLGRQSQPSVCHAMVNSRSIHMPQTHAAAPQTHPRYYIDPKAQGIRNAGSVGGRFISKEDLYIAAPLPGTTLTRIEAAFLSEAVSRNLPNLGLRLLCPRYTIDAARQQLQYVAQGDRSLLPRVQEKMWVSVMACDYERSKSESGEYILSDPLDADTDYRYQHPVKPLPLDRVAEHFLAVKPDFLAAEQGVSTTQPGQLDPPQGDKAGRIFWSPIDRIRGGGPSDEGLFAMHDEAGEQEEENESQHDDDVDQMAAPPDAGEEILAEGEPRMLVDVPRTSWQQRLVYVLVITTVNGQQRQEATAIGAVQMHPQLRGNINVRVALFHFSNAGYLAGPTSRVLPASHCFLVQEGTREANIANHWSGLAALMSQHPRYVSDDQTDEDSHGGDSEIVPGIPTGEANGNARNPPIQHEEEEDTSNDSRRTASAQNELGGNRLADLQNGEESGDDTEVSEPSRPILHGTRASTETVSSRQSEAGVRHEEVNKTEVNETSHHEDANDRPPTRNEEGEIEDRIQDDAGQDVAVPAGYDSRVTPHDGKSSDMKTMLAHRPKDSWKNSLVFAKVDTLDKAGTSAEDATVLGVVQDFSNVESQGNETEDVEVTVALFYVSAVGYLAESASQEFSATQLYIIQSGSDLDRIAMGWNGYRQWKEADTRNTVDQISGPAGSGVAHARTDDLLSDESVPIEDAAIELVRILCQRQQGPSPLGMLPDSRAVLWVQSDPRALYVRSEGRIFADSRSSEARLPCPWGCFCESRDERLCFATQEEMDDHVRVRHQFGDLNVDVEGGGHLHRTSEGRQVLTLNAQLASAICTECPSLSVSMERLSSGIRSFPLDSVLDLSPQGQGAPKKIIAGNVLSSTGSRLLQLWSKVSRLFAIESTGIFRLDTAACETLLHFAGSEKSPTSFLEITDDVQADACMNVAGNVATANKSRNCSLCGSRGDGGIETNVASGAGNHHPTPDISSCGLLCLLGRSHLMETIPPVGNFGPAGVARSMLIRIATGVPASLRRRANGSVGSASSLVQDPCIWEEGNYQNWRYLVERGSEIGSFLQAYVVLVHSLDVSKLPKWWTGARAGWSSAFATMGSAPHGFSSLFLRLYALDAAVFGYVTGHSIAGATASYLPHDNTPAVLRGLNNEERMKKVQEWANRVGYQRFSGVHESKCLVCRDGGVLLSCEFCETAQHAKCCVPPIDDPDASKLSIWACPMCVSDLAIFVEENGTAS